MPGPKILLLEFRDAFDDSATDFSWWRTQFGLQRFPRRPSSPANSGDGRWDPLLKHQLQRQLELALGAEITARNRSGNPPERGRRGTPDR